jgi:hypothetical protein
MTVPVLAAFSLRLIREHGLTAADGVPSQPPQELSTSLAPTHGLTTPA